MYDSLIIKDEYRKQAIHYLKQHYNFFKHAEKDPEKSIEFDPLVTEMFIMFTSLGLELLGRSPDEVRGAFNIYNSLRNPHFLTDKGKANFIDAVPEESREYALSMQKKQFFEVYTLLHRRHRSGAKHIAPGDSR